MTTVDAKRCQLSLDQATVVHVTQTEETVNVPAAFTSVHKLNSTHKHSETTTFKIFREDGELLLPFKCCESLICPMKVTTY